MRRQGWLRLQVCENRQPASPRPEYCAVPKRHAYRFRVRPPRGSRSFSRGHGPCIHAVGMQRCMRRAPGSFVSYETTGMAVSIPVRDADGYIRPLCVARVRLALEREIALFVETSPSVPGIADQRRLTSCAFRAKVHPIVPNSATIHTMITDSAYHRIEHHPDSKRKLIFPRPSVRG